MIQNAAALWKTFRSVNLENNSESFLTIKFDKIVFISFYCTNFTKGEIRQGTKWRDLKQRAGISARISGSYATLMFYSLSGPLYRVSLSCHKFALCTNGS